MREVGRVSRRGKRKKYHDSEKHCMLPPCSIRRLVRAVGQGMTAVVDQNLKQFY